MVTLHRVHGYFKCKRFFSIEQSGQGPFYLFGGANLSTETLSFYLGFSWGLLLYDKKNNDEVLFYTNS